MTVAQTISVADYRKSAPKRRDGNREARIQASIVERIRAVAPQCRIFAVPNAIQEGDLRARSEASRNRWTGVLAGVFDLVLLAPGPAVYFIEVKPPGEGLSDPQKLFRAYLDFIGIGWRIVRSQDEAMAALADWEIPIREAQQ